MELELDGEDGGRDGCWWWYWLGGGCGWPLKIGRRGLPAMGSAVGREGDGGD